MITSVAAADDATNLPVLLGAAPTVTASGWLNTEPLDARGLEGKVVLYDFWTFGCINCVHTLPHVKAWDQRYRDDGLVVLSIHTPEFSYEADPGNVRRFVADNEIRYPVALDPESVTWRAFANRYWPAFYLHDRGGRRRYQHFGEGAYEQTETIIRALLGVDPSSPRAVVVT
ncbi:MAG: redoxin domain-containing protein [Acidimicrobiales bacterium]